MKNLVLLAGGLLLGALLVSSPAMAQTTTTPSTLADLIADNALGGFQIQDKIFSDFVYTPTNTTHDAAANIAATPIFITLGPSQDQHGWSFNYKGGSWANDFSLSYKISVAPEYPIVFIVSSKDQIFGGQTGSALPSAVDTQSSGGLLGVLNLDNLTGAGQTQSLFFSPVRFVTTSSVVSVGEHGMASYEQNWFETTVGVPEPSMLLLLGFGLVGIAGFKRNIKK